MTGRANRRRSVSSHTPGPWTRGGCDAANPSHVFVSAKDGAVGIYDAAHTSETMANACLIAAAPCLLEFVEFVANDEDAPVDLAIAARQLVARVRGTK